MTSFFAFCHLQNQKTSPGKEEYQSCGGKTQNQLSSLRKLIDLNDAKLFQESVISEFNIVDLYPNYGSWRKLFAKASGNLTPIANISGLELTGTWLFSCVSESFLGRTTPKYATYYMNLVHNRKKATIVGEGTISDDSSPSDFETKGYIAYLKMNVKGSFQNLNLELNLR